MVYLKVRTLPLRLSGLLTATALLLPAQAANRTSPPTPQTAPATRNSGPAPAATGQRGADNQVGRMQEFLAIGAPPDPAAVERGKNVFVGTCGFCHGANAKGGESGPDLVRSVVVLHDENGDKI